MYNIGDLGMCEVLYTCIYVCECLDMGFFFWSERKLTATFGDPVARNNISWRPNTPFP